MQSNVCSTKISSKENGPACTGNTCDSGPDLTEPSTEEMIDLAGPYFSTANPEEQKKLCLDFLTLAGKDRTHADEIITIYASIGRKLGLSWEEMGQSLGMTGAGVRMMHRRAKVVQ